MIFILSLIILLNVGTCFSMAPNNVPKLLNLRTQILVSDSDNSDNKEIQIAQPRSGNKQLRLLFDLETNCLYCTSGKGLLVEESFSLPFNKAPAEAVTDVRVYGFDFVKPGIIFAIILAKKQIRNDSVFFMSIDLEKKLHTLWEGQSSGSFTVFQAAINKKSVEIYAESINIKAINGYSRSTVVINLEKPDSSLQYKSTLSGELHLNVFNIPT